MISKLIQYKSAQVVTLVARVMSSTRYLCGNDRVLTDLPSVWTLPTSRRSFLVEHLDNSSPQLFSVFSLISAAAARGDNVGLDEYPSVEHLAALVRPEPRTSALVFSSPLDRRVECALVVEPCRYVRTASPSVCTLRLLTSESNSRPDIWRDLVNIAQRLARLPTLSYRACIVDVFVPCSRQLLAFSAEGFHVTACIPLAGKLGSGDTYVGNYILYKELYSDGLDLAPIAPPQNTDTKQRHHKSDVLKEQVFTPTLKSVSYLPVTHVLADGTELIIRSLQLDEIPKFYAALKESASGSNSGYGYDEMSSLDDFKRGYLDGFYAPVFQLKSTGEIVAFASFGQASSARTNTSIICDGNLIIMPKYRKSNLSQQLSRILQGMSADCGYHGFQSDMAETLHSATGWYIASEFVINGKIPRAVYYLDIGWVNMIMLYRHIDSTHSYINGSTASKL